MTRAVLALLLPAICLSILPYDYYGLLFGKIGHGKFCMSCFNTLGVGEVEEISKLMFFFSKIQCGGFQL